MADTHKDDLKPQEEQPIGSLKKTGTLKVMFVQCSFSIFTYRLWA